MPRDLAFRSCSAAFPKQELDHIFSTNNGDSFSSLPPVFDTIPMPWRTTFQPLTPVFGTRPDFLCITPLATIRSNADPNNSRCVRVHSPAHSNPSRLIRIKLHDRLLGISIAPMHFLILPYCGDRRCSENHGSRPYRAVLPALVLRESG